MVLGQYISFLCFLLGNGQEGRSVNGNITIGANAQLNGVGLGFPVYVGPGEGNTGTSGGTHGGKGGDNTHNPYGNATAPTSLGSGSYGQAGGSAIKLQAVDLVIVDGIVNISGVNGNWGGAGGSIWLKANNISGSGTIKADGGTATTREGGGGGRIRLEYGSSMSYTGIVSVAGGLEAIGYNPGLSGTLTFTNNTWQGDWNLTGNVGLLGGNYGDGATINVRGNFNTNNYNLTIYGDCFYSATNSVTCYNTTADGKGVWINASGNITVSSGSYLDGVGLGFPAGVGPGSMGTQTVGGTYGGRGGSNTKATYGNETQPTSLGSGSYNRAGGSAIKLETSNNILSVNGLINMSGVDGIVSSTYGGAGGSIWLKANNISGIGTLEASGGISTTRHAGGGGRVALTAYSVVEFSGKIVNKGGSASSGYNPGSGGT